MPGKLVASRCRRIAAATSTSPPTSPPRCAARWSPRWVALGIAIEASHHEVAAGQHEIDFAPNDALRMADAVVTARSAIKAIAQRHELHATFLPKPFYGVNGSGMHTHQRLLRASDGANAFTDRRRPE